MHDVFLTWYLKLHLFIGPFSKNKAIEETIFMNGKPMQPVSSCHGNFYAACCEYQKLRKYFNLRLHSQEKLRHKTFSTLR